VKLIGFVLEEGLELELELGLELELELGLELGLELELELELGLGLDEELVLGLTANPSVTGVIVLAAFCKNRTFCPIVSTS